MRPLYLYIIFFTLLIPASLSAQIIPYLSFQGQIYGQDEFETHPYPLQGANIHFVCIGDTTYTGTVTTDEKGNILNNDTPQPKKMNKDMRTKVTVSYIGMEPFDTIVSRETAVIGGMIMTMNCYNLGKIVLRSKPMTMQEAQIIGELKKIYQEGDTTVFNTDAYEMPDGSVLLELVRRLPGLDYREGALTYKGRNIDEIRLNGEAFFKNDLSIALKNIPNAKLRKLRIYEAANDSLDISSPKHLVMDMETKDPVTHTIFANGEAGKASTPEGWKAAADVSLYKRGGTQFYASGNMQRLPNTNIAERRLDMGGARVSYSRKLPKISISSDFNNSYYKRYGDMSTYTRRFLTENTLITDSRNDTYSKLIDNNGSIALSGRLNSKARWKTSIDLKHQQEWNLSDNHTETSSVAGRMTGSHIPLTQQTAINSVKQRTTGYCLDKEANWNGEFSFDLSPKNTLNIGLSLSTGEHDTQNDNRNEITYHQSETQQTYDRHTDNNNTHLKAGGYLNFMRRFGKQHYWKVGYNINNNHKQANYDLYNIEADAVVLDQELSYDNTDNTFNQNVSGELVLQKNKLTLTAQMNINFQKLNYQVSPFAQDAAMTDTTINYIIYRPLLRLKYGGMERNVELSYKGDTNTPGLSHLISIPNVDDPLNVVEGNNRLKQAFNHNFELSIAPHEIFSVNGHVTLTTNKIDRTRQYNPETGASIIRYGNTNGNWRATYGASLYKILGEVGLSLGVKDNYEHSVTQVANFGDNGMRKSVTTGHRIETNGKISYGNKHLQTSADLTYTKDLRHNNLMDDRINTDHLYIYFTGTGYLPCNLSLTTNIIYNMYKGLQGETNTLNRCMWNLELEYKFLKGKRGSIKLGWYDVLRNGSYEEHQFNDTEWTETWRSGKTSYVLLSFAYRFTLM